MSPVFDITPLEPKPESVVEEFNEAESSEIFTLYYRKGGDILNLHFKFLKKKDLTPREHFRLAIERAKLHCERMRYRFLFCRTYITDLEADEQRMAI